MTTMHDEVGRDTVALSTRLTVGVHEEAELRRRALLAELEIAAHLASPGLTGPIAACPSYTPHGCRQLDWAHRTAADLAQGRLPR